MPDLSEDVYLSYSAAVGVLPSTFKHSLGLKKTRMMTILSYAEKMRIYIHSFRQIPLPWHYVTC